MSGAFAMFFLLLGDASAGGPSATCPTEGCLQSEPGAALLQVAAEGASKRTAADDHFITNAKFKDVPDIKSTDMALHESARGISAEGAERVDGIPEGPNAESAKASDAGRGKMDKSLADVRGDGRNGNMAENGATQPLSLLSVSDMKEADSVPLNQDGYKALTLSRSNRKMERFVERLLEKMHLEVVDIGGLKGMVPYYSGQKAKQSFAALRTELATRSKTSHSWVVKSSGSWLTKNTKVKKTRPEVRGQKGQEDQKSQKGDAPEAVELAKKKAKASPKRAGRPDAE